MPVPRLSASARIATGLVSLTALASIGVEFTIQMGRSGAAEALWSLARYFTYLTNAAVAAVLGAAALRGRWPDVSLPAASTMWISVTGIVYHALLARTHDPQGVQIVSNFGLHTAVPLGCFAAWVFCAPKHGLTWFHPLIWTVWPLVYAIYALLRGHLDGVYPYFFLDPASSGITAVIAYIAGLGLLFALSGGLLVMLAKLLGKSAGPDV